MVKSYLYVGMYYDIFSGRNIGINDKKIGLTINPNNRESSLNATKGPIGYMFIKLYECSGEKTANEIESIFHTLLDDRNTHGEWYEDENEDIIGMVESVMNNLINLGVDIKEIDLELDPTTTKMEREQIRRSKNTKLTLLYNGENLSDRFAVKTYLNGIKRISEIVGWDKIVEEGDIDVYKTIEELYDRFPYYKDKNVKVCENLDGYYVWVFLNNDIKIKRLNKLTNRFNISGMTCTIDG